MSKLQGLKSASSLRELAVVLGYQPKAISYILYRMPRAGLYHEFEIPKKSGGVRLICSPCDELRLLQRKVSDYLQDCLLEINAQRNCKTSISHAYRKKHSIATNANVHKRRRFVFSIDLNDFFGSINFGRVRGFFISNDHFKLNPAVATVLAQIVCYNNSLPQGSPCSPVVSNLIGHILDVRLAKLARDNGCSYTRYADDLTFSTSKKIFPSVIANISELDLEWKPGRKLKKIIKDSGFGINSQKTRMQYRDSAQVVTGLMVNKKVNTAYKYRRYARAMADSLFRTGIFYLPSPLGDREVGNMDQLSGVFSYIHMVAEYRRLMDPTGGSRELSGIEKVYRRFLFFKKFYSNSRPLIIYEGKTDAIYLKSAIRYFSKKMLYPELAVFKDSVVEYKVDFFRFSKTVGRILGLTGGADQLRKLIEEYSSMCSGFSAPGNTKPVIMVLDNDTGAKKIYSLIKQFSGQKMPVDGSEGNYSVVRNLFVVPTPGQDSMIENFFGPDALGYQVGGKSLDLNSDYDGASKYGKNTFAEQVVSKNQDVLDFSGFAPLLDRIVSVITYYNVGAVAANVEKVSKS